MIEVRSLAMIFISPEYELHKKIHPQTQGIVISLESSGRVSDILRIPNFPPTDNQTHSLHSLSLYTLELRLAVDTEFAICMN